MTQEEFDKKCKEPINILAAHSALSRFIDGRGKLHIPVRPEDDDMLISRALNELHEARILLAQIKATGAELVLQYENIYGLETDLSKEFSQLLKSV